jgi:ribonucleoside-diphosphate reductase alpha chain
MTDITRPANDGHEQATSTATESAEAAGGAGSGLRIDRVFTTEGVHPYAEVGWELRDVLQTNWRTGETVFEQHGVEFPDFWSVNASTIVATKYFRGAVGTPSREHSLKQLIDRVVGTYRRTGQDNGYFATEADADIFSEELTWLLLHQYFSFNSPVWFNVGTSAPQQVSACFILSVDDSIDSILNWYKQEGFIFKGGSGAGLNLSRIRSSKELLSSGGTASGPVSFMRGADASAGTIKSGGATRRAAKMVVLDVDHPDIEEFVETKAREEDKIKALRDAGYDMDLGGRDIASVQYQNANNSVRVTDEFMRAVEEGGDFGLRARTDHRVTDDVSARHLFDKISQAAWECADPGLQYDDTINDWHTNPETGRITASNPCFPADQRVVTDQGLVRIGDLVDRAVSGERFDVYTHDATSADNPTDRIVATRTVRYMTTGTNQILELRFSDGSRLRCTPNHRLWTGNRGWVHAEDLRPDDRMTRSLHYAARPMASAALPEAAQRIASQATSLNLPEKWDEDLAHLLGWLVGDGCLTDNVLTLVYGSEDDQQEVMPRHQALLRHWTGFDAQPSRQGNGTIQLRCGKRAVIDFFSALGASKHKAAEKLVPEPVFEAPEDVVLGFLSGLYDADGCIVDDEVKGTRYVGLGSRSEELLLGVQELLASFGVGGHLYKTGIKAESFSYPRKDGSEVTYGSDGPTFDLRITGRSLREFAAQAEFSLSAKHERLLHVIDHHHAYAKDETVSLISRESAGFETTYNLTEPRNQSYIVSGVVVSNCSEYMSLDNSSCNLASLNLMKFLADDNTFEVEKFSRAVELIITAMDISITFADFPTEAITQTTRDYRQLGIGYANLGALLMATGHGYDSEGGRSVAAAITSLMTGVAYRRSAELAAVVGPYAGYARNAQAHKRVMRKHRAANDELRPLSVIDGQIQADAARAWESVIKLGEQNGYRNAQASLLAPTGTIGFMLDCDTTGIEPDFSLVKFKKLVGGGSMQIVNQTIPRALKLLGYTNETAEAIVEYIAEHGHVIDAPGLRPEHYEVFDCAMGARAIKPMGHVQMMAATQPFLSGAISKTVNLPESATVEDIADVYLQGWKLGLKALAVYRDNCKVGQPLSEGKNKDKDSQADEPPSEEVKVEYRPVRARLPKSRPSRTTSFSVGGAEGYMTSGSYPDDGLGEVFLKLGKQGSTLAGVMDAFSIAVSIGLQYGVPLETFIQKFTNLKFEPAGLTDDPDVRMAQSIMDYIFRRLALDYLTFEQRSELGIYTATERARQVETGSYLPPETDEGSDSQAEELKAGDGAGAAEAQTAAPATGQASSSAGAQPAARTAESRTAERTPESGSAHTTAELMEEISGTSIDAPLCFTCGTKMRPSGSCYVCEGCGSTSGCS